MRSAIARIADDSPLSVHEWNGEDIRGAWKHRPLLSYTLVMPGATRMRPTAEACLDIRCKRTLHDRSLADAPRWNVPRTQDLVVIYGFAALPNKDALAQSARGILRIGGHLLCDAPPPNNLVGFEVSGNYEGVYWLTCSS